jgi:hypothetical protein
LGRRSSPLPRSIPHEYKPFQSQLILQQEVDEDSNTMVVMKYDAVLDTLVLTQEVMKER